MACYIIWEETIAPEALIELVKSAFPCCCCRWQYVSFDVYEFTVYFCDDLAMLEDIVAEFV